MIMMQAAHSGEALRRRTARVLHHKVLPCCGTQHNNKKCADEDSVVSKTWIAMDLPSCSLVCRTFALA